MTKYPRPCAGCDRLMRPSYSPANKEKYPTAEITHYGRGLCGKCYTRKVARPDHLTGNPTRGHDAVDRHSISKPIRSDMLTRLAEVHPPTAYYIQDRRRRGIPTTGLRRKAK